MKYSDVPAMDSVYALIAELAEPENPEETRLDDAMIIASALIELGEDRSWASVWWAYCALHYDLSDEALTRGRELLDRVDHPIEAKAAALMFSAEIQYTQAVYAREDPSLIDQRILLDQALSLVPDWPALSFRLAQLTAQVGDEPAARRHAAESVILLASGPTQDPFDSAITGRNLDPAYIERELSALGLIDEV